MRSKIKQRIGHKRASQVTSRDGNVTRVLLARFSALREKYRTNSCGSAFSPHVLALKATILPPPVELIFQ